MENLKDLGQIYRTPIDFNKRLGKIRLDKNEYLGEFPKFILNQIKNLITSDFLSTYPGLFYKKLSSWIKLPIENLIVLRSFSKIYGLASLRLGFAAADRKIIKYLYKVRPMYEINAFACKIGILLMENDRLVEKYLKEIKAGEEYLFKNLKN